jgi:hypothetical protein
MTNLDAKREHEEWVARLFCKHCKESCEFVKMADPPEPDAVVCIAGQEVCLELAQYREKGPYNAALPNDTALCRAIFEQAQQERDLPSCDIYLYYCRGADRPFNIPVPNDYPAFIGELFMLVRCICADEREEAFDVILTPTTDPMIRRREDRKRVDVSNSGYPALSRCCCAIGIRKTQSLCFGLPSSSMHTRFVPPYEPDVQSIVQQKLCKVRSYRKAIGGKALGLLFYSTGCPATAHLVGPDHNTRVVLIMRSLFKSASESFDRAWWADQAYQSDGPDIFPAWP